MTTTEMRIRASDPDGRYPADYELRLAATASEVRAAQQLRDRVLTTEFGARTPGPAGLDSDEFDDRCDHLIVWHRVDSDAPQIPVATYRLLPPYANDSNPLSSGLYASTEFDLTPLESLLPATVEAGRACVDPAHRTATPIALLWRGIARYLQITGNRYLIGCGSVALADGGVAAAAFEAAARSRWWAPPDLQCRPHRMVRSERQGESDRLQIPALLRGYLRLGAWVCGRPAWDPAFGTADFLLLLDLHRTDPRYLRRFQIPGW